MTHWLRFAALIAFVVISAGFFFEPKVPMHRHSSGGTLFMPAYDNLSQSNWNHAGLADVGGIPNRTTQCGSTVTPSGLTPPQANDDAVKIQNAINACTAGLGTLGQVVQLAAGTFHFAQSESIQINQSITLRGTGNCTQGGAASESWGHGPYCQTVIQTDDGPWPFYQSGGQGVANCGTTTATPPLGTAPTPTTCPNVGAQIIVGLNGGAWTGCQSNNAIVPTTDCAGTPTNLSADAAFGDTSVTVNSATGFSSGMVVLIDEFDNEQSLPNPLGTCTVNCGGYINPIKQMTESQSTSPTPVTQRTIFPDECQTGQPGASYWFCFQRITSELKLITNVSGNTITFDTPLTMAYRISNSHDARLYYPTAVFTTSSQPFVQEAGIENMSLYRMWTPLTMDWCFHCWVKGVDAGWWIGGLTVHASLRSEITGNYIHDCIDCSNNGNEYPLAIDSGSTENLAENNIIFKGGKGMVGRASTANVVANNYSARHQYEQASIGDYFLDQDINASHEGGTHHFDLEGNYGSSCQGDNTHGSAGYHTFFRNWCRGFRDVFIDYTCGKPSGDTCNGSSSPQTINDTVTNGAFNGWAFTSDGVTSSSRLLAAGVMTFNYWYSFVDNLLGVSGVTTSGNGWIYQSAHTAISNSGPGMTDHTMWMLGWSGNEGQGVYGSDPNLDGTNTPRFLFRNGNYDYVNNAIMDNAAGYNQTFPHSLYRSSAPAYFTSTNCIYPWPWVTPENSTKLPSPTNNGGNTCTADFGLPAKARWDAGTPFVQP